MAYGTETKRKIAWLRKRGFIVGARDERLNRAFIGAWMVAEEYEKGHTQDDGRGGVWCIVGNSLAQIVDDAYENFYEKPKVTIRHREVDKWRRIAGELNKLEQEEKAKREIDKWRRIAGELKAIWYRTYSYEEFGEEADATMRKLFDMLEPPANEVPVKFSKSEYVTMHAALNGTPVVDAAAPKAEAEDFRGIPEVKDHVIRAYNTDSNEVVYWHVGWGWRTSRADAKRYDRLKALELANNINSINNNNSIINVCAIQEID